MIHQTIIKIIRIVIKEYDYDAFGNVINDGQLTGGNGLSSEAEFSVSNIKFHGREYDPETGYYYFRHRYHSPTLGRFLSRDPVNYVDGMHLYRFCWNNTLIFIDPYGLEKLRINVKKGQPMGERNSKGGWGHAWIDLETNSGNSRSYGSYPNGLSNSDSKRNPDITVEFEITHEQFQNIMEGIYEYGNDNWTELSENCTDFIYKVTEDWAGIDLPGSGWGIDYPDDLYELLKELQEEQQNSCEQKS